MKLRLELRKGIKSEFVENEGEQIVLKFLWLSAESFKHECDKKTPNKLVKQGGAFNIIKIKSSMLQILTTRSRTYIAFVAQSLLSKTGPLTFSYKKSVSCGPKHYKENSHNSFVSVCLVYIKNRKIFKMKF